MRRILCVAVVVSGGLTAWTGSASAGMSEGVAAVTVGDYPKAISEFQPMAASGDAAAQYQLAKIYLEGHGPANGVPEGIDLMTKAANGNYPEAQAQLGLMYAMGLGVPVDNVKAYDWLTKAVKALPEGTRRTVAEANRDAVLKRMNASQQNAVAAATSMPATTAKPAMTQDASKTPAPTTMPAKPATSSATTATTGKTMTETTASKPADMKKTDTQVAAAAKPAAMTPTASKPAGITETVAKTGDAKTGEMKTGDMKTGDAKMPDAKMADAKAGDAKAGDAKKSDATTKIASAQGPEAMPAKADPKAQPTGVRIQLVSMPSEQAAWDAWKRLSDKYSAQLTGLTAMVETADLGTKGTFYRVQTGPFDTVAAAQERCGTMKEAGLDCLVVGKP